MGHQILAVGEVLWDLLPNGKQLGVRAGQLHVSMSFTWCRCAVGDAGRR